MRWTAMAAWTAALTTTAWAQSAELIGDDFLVNSTTLGFQVRAWTESSSTGDFVTVWDTTYEVYARRFDRSASPLADDFQVNSYSTFPQTYPDVAVGSNGDFVVVWQSGSLFVESDSQDGSFSSIHGQRYDASGVALGDEFQVNSYTTNRQRLPDVAIAGDGSFVVVWTTNGSYGPATGYSIQGQRFDASGSRLGGEFQINSYTSGAAIGPSIDTWDDGRFVVVWQDNTGSVGDDTSGFSVQGRRFSANGSPSGSDFQLNSFTFNNQLEPRVAVAPQGTFAAVWASQGSVADDFAQLSVQGQRFASDGAPIGEQFQVNTFTTFDQRKPRLAYSSEGDFVVTWTSGNNVSGDGPDGSLQGIQGQHFGADGRKAGTEFQINTVFTSNQYRSSIAVQPDGEFVVTWESEYRFLPDTSAGNVQGQRIGTWIFTDGFESGDTAAWSSSQ
ncbi:MAG: hypothetical protein P8Y44_11810 [Acidobacteriota bacterium]